MPKEEKRKSKVINKNLIKIIVGKREIKRYIYIKGREEKKIGREKLARNRK